MPAPSLSTIVSVPVDGLPSAAPCEALVTLAGFWILNLTVSFGSLTWSSVTGIVNVLVVTFAGKSSVPEAGV